MAEVLCRAWELLIDIKLKEIAPLVISIVALYVSLRDRSPKLRLQARKGEWYVLNQATSSTGKNVRFAGVVEVYNMSARANAIRSYEFWCKKGNKWELMESERFSARENGGPEQIFNGTPVTIAPYSGCELQVSAYSLITPMPRELDVRVEVEDVFGKRYRMDLRAKS